MAHELEHLANGQTAFVSARQHAWHRLGIVTDATLSASDIIAKAFLGGWRVRKIPLQGVETTPDGVNIIAIDDKWMTVRTNVLDGRTEALGIVGDEYTVVQNEEAGEVLDLLVDQIGGAHCETAGSLRGGKSIFVTMKLPQTMCIAGVDNLDLYLAATTSHDGMEALRVTASPVRIVCANTQRAAFAQSVGHYTFRHTAKVKEQVQQAREAIGLTWKYLDTFQAAAEKMINETLTMGQFEQIVAQLWPLADDASEATVQRAKQRTSTLRYLIRDSDTQAAIRGTKWAGYQAITEYVDHYAPGKPEARAARAVAGPTAELKTRAFDLLSV